MSFIQKFIADYGLQDSRFWRFISEEGDNVVLMYGDILGIFGGYILSHALENAKNKGYKLNTTITIGKYKGLKTIQWIKDNDKSYWNWLVENKVLLLHPEVFLLYFYKG